MKFFIKMSKVIRKYDSDKKNRRRSMITILNNHFGAAKILKNRKKAKDLSKGDKISTGTISYVGTPQTYMGSKNQVRIDIIYKGKTDYMTRYWNANTELVIFN